MKLKTIAERLRWLLGQADISAARLDALCGRRPGHASMVLAGARRAPTADTIERFAQVLGASAGWLGFGEGAAPTAEVIAAAVEAATRRSKRRKAA